MPHTVVRLIDWNETADPLKLGKQWQEEFKLAQTPDVRIVQRPHPHIAFRLGFPEFRMICAYAPHVVVLSNKKKPAWTSLLTDLGCPVVKEENVKAHHFPEEATWTKSHLSGNVLGRLKEAERVTILAEGVAPEEGDGVTIGTDVFAPFADPAPDFYLHRMRSVQIPLPEGEPINVASLTEDAYVAGQPVLPLVVRHEVEEAYAKAIVRSSALWPTIGVPSAGTLVGATEVYRFGDRSVVAPYAHLLVALRAAGLTCPILYRMSQTEKTEVIDPQVAMDFASMMQKFELQFADGRDHADVKPLSIRVDLKDMEAGFVSSGLAEWLARVRGVSDGAIEKTWVQAPGTFGDFLMSLGYQEGEPPSGTPQVMINLPAMMPLM